MKKSPAFVSLWDCQSSIIRLLCRELEVLGIGGVFEIYWEGIGGIWST